MGRGGDAVSLGRRIAVCSKRETVPQARREPEKAESLEKTTGLETQSDSQDGQSGSEETEQGRKGQQGSFQTLCPAQTSGTFPVCGGNLRTGRK